MENSTIGICLVPIADRMLVLYLYIYCHLIPVIDDTAFTTLPTIHSRSESSSLRSETADNDSQHGEGACPGA